jgi:hypothetical protein
MRDWAGQLGESGEYRMGRSESGPHDIRSSEGGSLHLCRLKSVSVGPPATSIDPLLTHMGYMGPCKPSSFDGHWVGRYLTSLHGCLEGIGVWATHGLPGEVFTSKTALGWGRIWSLLFDSHRKRWSLMLPSWLTCVMLSGYFPLQGDYWFESLRHPRIWVKFILWVQM